MSMEKTSPNPFMLAAALLMAMTASVHVFVGGPEVMAPLRQTGIDPVAAAVLQVVWHMVTLMLVAAAGALAYLVRRRNPALSVLLIVINLGTALLFLAYGAALLGTVWPMPQWVIFLALAGLTAIGLRRG